MLFITGCSMFGPLQKATQEERVPVMGLWHLYKHCVSTASAEEQVADADQLAGAAEILTGRAGSISILPASIEGMLSPQPNRLAVDPRAMVAACSLSAGKTFLSRGDDAMAAEIFRSILLAYQEPQYAYYAVQARIGLGQSARLIQPEPPVTRRTAGVNIGPRGEPSIIR